MFVNGYAISTMNLHTREESVRIESGRKDDHVCLNESVRGLYTFRGDFEDLGVREEILIIVQGVEVTAIEDPTLITLAGSQ